MPPSLHANGKRYEWKRAPEDVELAQAPRWLLARLTELRNPNRPADGQRRRQVPGGQRHTALVVPARRYALAGAPQNPSWTPPPSPSSSTNASPTPNGRWTWRTSTPPPGTSPTATSPTHDRMGSMTTDDHDDPKPAKGKRTLPWLPDYGAPLGEVRDWLTVALGFPPGSTSRTSSATAAAKTDACVLVVSTPAAAAANTGSTNNANCRCRPSCARHHVARPTGWRGRGAHQGRAEDVWIALVTLATDHGAADQGRRDPRLARTSSWAPRAPGRQTLEGEGQFDALQAWRDRPSSTRTAAQHVAALRDDERPVLLVDSQTGRRYVRASDAATYVRHVVAGVGPILAGDAERRMAGIGVEVIDV